MLQLLSASISSNSLFSKNFLFEEVPEVFLIHYLENGRVESSRES